MTVERRSKRWPAARLVTVTRRLMNASPLCAIATVSPRGGVYISHVYFAWTDSFDVCWISDPDSRHSRNLATKSSAAVTIYDSRQIWGRPDRGIHLFGAAAEVVGRSAREAGQAYVGRFPATTAWTIRFAYIAFARARCSCSMSARWQAAPW